MADTTPSITIIVSYAATHPTTGESLKFNKDYYLNNHVRDVIATWTPFGLRGYDFVEFTNPNPLTGQAPPYLYQMVGYFDTMENLNKAMAVGQESAQKDLPNFTNIAPVIWLGTKSVEKRLS